MIDLVVKQLKTGAATNVIPFGAVLDDSLPAAPYLVVKEEPTNLGYTRYRIIGHALPSQLLWLRGYMRSSVYKLLHEVVISGTGTDTRKITLQALPGESLGTPVMENADKTVSIERLFMTPEIQA